MLEHGGRVRRAAREFGIAAADWLDLSTGINPNAYPVGVIDPAAWQRLPEDDDGLEAAAAAYYGTPRLLVSAGSQPVIQTLPGLFGPARVAVLTPTYAEHPQHWARASHTLRRFAAAELETAAAAAEIVVLCAPNNPDAARVDRERLLAVAAALAKRGGNLVVDEAFADAEDACGLVTLAGSAAAPNLIVLRSLGKFFGLAGARVGFVAAAADHLDRLREAGGPWPVSGPARAVARQALADRGWQRDTAAALQAASRRLGHLLAPLGETAGTALFRWLPHADAARLSAAFAGEGILLRCFKEPAGLRFGLPGNDNDWQRLARAVDKLK